MTDTPVSPDTDDLDAFETLFRGKALEAAPEEAVKEEGPEDDALAPEDTEEPLDPEEDLAEADDEPEAEPEPVKKKSRFQERIDDLTSKAKEAERREAEAQRRLDEILSKFENLQKEEPKKAPVVQDSSEPTPDTMTEDGIPKYPLGEFDPNFIRDLTRYTFQKEAEAVKEAEAKSRQAQEAQDRDNALANSWKEKVTVAKEKYPDLVEKAQELSSSLSGLDSQYGDFLAETIMDMDNGTDVLYHLSTNVDEAKRISSMDPVKATLALGRISALYSLNDEEKQTKKLKVSKAPEPPERINKGTSVTKDIPDDTDDLDAFEQKFFSKKRR